MEYIKATKPIYREVKDDGAAWKCASCGGDFNHKQVWFIETPDGRKEISCKECADGDWLERAVKGSNI